MNVAEAGVRAFAPRSRTGFRRLDASFGQVEGLMPRYSPSLPLDWLVSYGATSCVMSDTNLCLNGPSECLDSGSGPTPN